MSLEQERFFGGHDKYIELRITSASNEVISISRVDLPPTAGGLPFRGTGRLAWLEDDLVEVTCPSKDFARGEFRMQLRVPRQFVEQAQ